MTQDGDVMKLKRDGEKSASAVPLYQQVKAYIEDRIITGKWAPGSKIASENKLVEKFGISRMTANRSLRELTAEGKLLRVQGIGTFVARKKPASSLLEIKSIAVEIKQRGGCHSCRVHLMETVRPGGELAVEMGFPEGKEMYHSVVIHYDNRVAVQLADRYVNPQAAPGYLAQDLSSVDSSEYLLEMAPVDEIEHIAEAILPDEEQRTLLAMEPGDPCLVLHRKTWFENVLATRSRFYYPGTRHQVGGRFKP